MRLIIAGVLITMVALPFTLSASLGGDFASVEADRAKMQATLQSTNSNSYAVHQLQTSAGAVKEYVSSAGQVFAVSWQSTFQPDLQQVLGSYYGQFADSIKTQRAHRRGHGPVFVQQPGLVVQIGGHPRSFWGKAYVPQMLPAGVHAEDIR